MSSASPIRVVGPLLPGFDSILTKDALTFLYELHQNFEQGRRAILAARVERQKELDAGKLPTFLASTASIRSSDYKAAPVVRDLSDRRVEITGPVDRKMLINALNSGAKVFMADFEDATSPTWENIIGGQVNVKDAVNRTITYSANGKSYKLKPENQLATLMVRPRGWHLIEAHIEVDGAPMSGSLVDFGLYFFHNAKNLIARGSGPYFYLPKMEGHKEARLWNDVFVYSQKRLGIPNGTIRATVLIETILAAYEMDEIIYELRDHSAGLNCGRWDYIFSFIKKFRAHPQYVLPDRALVTMTTPWLANYVKLLIQTCHRRGVHAMGGMAAQIPSNDQAVNAAAFEKVKADKLREVKMGCDGTWVAHPALIPIAQKVFDEHMPTPNQLSVVTDKTPVKASDLLDLGVSQGKVSISEDGFRANISVGLSYLEAWIRGNGCVPLHNLMEDAATAEISRCQVWQWNRHGAQLSNGKKVTKQLIEQELSSELNHIKQALGDKYNSRKFDLAGQLYHDMLLNDTLDDFLTTVAYPYIVTKQTQIQSRL